MTHNVPTFVVVPDLWSVVHDVYQFFPLDSTKLLGGIVVEHMQQFLVRVVSKCLGQIQDIIHINIDF